MSCPSPMIQYVYVQVQVWNVKLHATPTPTASGRKLRIILILILILNTDTNTDDKVIKYLKFKVIKHFSPAAASGRQCQPGIDGRDRDRDGAG